MTQTFRTRVENICILILFCLSLGMFALSFLHRLPAEAALLISTHLIADVEPVLDDVIFIDRGRIALTASVDYIREEKGKSVDALFREVFRC